MIDLRQLQSIVDESPFCAWWGLVVESGSDGRARIRLPIRPELLRPGGILHGGGVVVAADVAVWVAIMATVADGKHAVTTHLATDYLAPAMTDIISEATLIKIGRRLVVATAESRTADGTLVAIHNVTFARSQGSARKGAADAGSTPDSE